MTEYGSYCPIALTSEVIADRWTPLIIRELILGNTRFNDIARGLPGISRSLLVQRLKHLERKGVIETWPLQQGRGSEYVLTAAGKDLFPVIMALGQWAVAWLYDDLRSDDVDAQTLMWWIHRRMDTSKLPAGRTVVQFDHTAPDRRSFWIVADRGDVSVCHFYPGFESDVVVTCTTQALAEVFSGQETWQRSVGRESIRVFGPDRLLKAMPRWFMWSPFVDAVRSRTAALTGAGQR